MLCIVSEVDVMKKLFQSIGVNIWGTQTETFLNSHSLTRKMSGGLAHKSNRMGTRINTQLDHTHIVQWSCVVVYRL